MSGRVVHVNDQVEGAVYIGRAMNRRGLASSRWGNPYKIGDHDHGDRTECIERYAADLERFRNTPLDLLHHLPELRDRPLACWCRHEGEERTAESACHGDVLLAILDRYTDDELRAMEGAA